MSIGFIYSKDVLIKAKKGDGTYYPLFCVEDLTISTRKGLVETVGTDGGGWDEWTYDKRRGWELQMSGVSVLSNDSSGWTLSDIWTHHESFNTLDIKIYMTDVNSNQIVKKGTVLTSELGLAANMAGGEKAKWSLVLKGTGSLGDEV